MTDRGLIFYPDGSVDEVDEDGNISTRSGDDGQMYEELLAAGYPVMRDSISPAECIDVSVDAAGVVTAYTTGSGKDVEHPMGAAPQNLAAWLAQTKEADK